MKIFPYLLYLLLLFSFLFFNFHFLFNCLITSKLEDKVLSQSNFFNHTPAIDQKIIFDPKQLLFVQTKMYQRDNIRNNNQFEIFFLEKTEYIFRNDKYPRNCNDSCYFADQLNILKILSKYDYKFYYIIEDDTFLCTDPKLIYLLTLSNQNLLLTGIGASGILFNKSMIEILIKSEKEYDGLDVMIATDYMNYVTRFKFNLNIHLYEKSISHSHGDSSKSLYPQCFEYSCQKGLNHYDRFNFNCKYFTKSKTNQCIDHKNELLDTYEIYGFHGKYCKEKTLTSN